MLPVLSDNTVPHLNQTAYQRGVSCSDVTFACQETISKFIRDGDSIYSCFYDLSSAFDTVEYPTLLSHLKRTGISGKAWHLVKNLYSNIHSTVRIDGQTSPSFSVSRGVRQGSSIPTLFLLVIDPILLELNRRSSGPSICGLYLGAFAHADDIPTLATNITDCKLQISYISEYISSQGLALNVDKCEATISPSLPADATHIQAGDVLFPLTNSAKCLGALWTPNLSCSSRWIEDNIKKVRRAMFSQGSGVFNGTLNPLSSKSIIEHCVLPCLLYGAESWLLNPTPMRKLESFQAELAK